ncbi:MAG: hypothetical protein ACR2GX_09600 [Candidatus Dormibacteria bacterium]
MATPSDTSALNGRAGPFRIDWPRSAGYFGGIGVAVALGVVDPPLGLFIAAVPFVKMLNSPEAKKPLRYVSQFLEGMAKPVGGDSEGTVTLARQLPGATTRGNGGKPRRSPGNQQRRRREPTALTSTRSSPRRASPRRTIQSSS